MIFPIPAKRNFYFIGKTVNVPSRAMYMYELNETSRFHKHAGEEI